MIRWDTRRTEPEPELALVLATAWRPAAGDRAEHTERLRRLAARGVDWERVLELIAHHRVAPLAFANLAGGGAAVPAAVLERLRLRARRCRMRALAQLAELDRLRVGLHERGIESLSLKGPVLSQQLHGDFALRESNDLDLLVRPARFREADRVVRALGYRLVDAPEGAFTETQWQTMHRHPCSLGYRHEQTGLALDLHRTPSPDTTEAERELLWRSRVRVACGGSEADALAPAPLLLYLCSHGGKHAWFRLKWLSDVASLLARGDAVDVAQSYALARAHGQERSLALGMLLARDLFGIETDARRATDPGLQWLVSRCLQRIEHPSASRRTSFVEPAIDLFAAKLLAPSLTWREILAARNVDPRDGKALALPPRWRAAYTFLRVPLALQRRLHRKLAGRVAAP